MVRYFAIGVFVLSLGLFVAPKNSAANDCDILVSPREMLECYGQQFKNANRELDDLLQRLNKVLNAKEQKAVKEAQAAWVTYRDAHCRSISLPYSPGSITPAVRAACLAKLTRQRVKELSDDFQDSLEAPTGKADAPGLKKN